MLEASREQPVPRPQPSLVFLSSVGQGKKPKRSYFSHPAPVLGHGPLHWPLWSHL